MQKPEVSAADPAGWSTAPQFPPPPKKKIICPFTSSLSEGQSLAILMWKLGHNGRADGHVCPHSPLKKSPQQVELNDETHISQI